MNILAIESSCDETAAAVIEDGTKIISNCVASSKKMHEKYGGIVPEVASREQLAYILPVIREALQPLDSRLHGNDDSADIINRHIDAIAITVGPGLIGSLLIGVETAKAIAFVTKKPIIPVNHVLAHIYANMVLSSSLPAEALAKEGVLGLSKTNNLNQNLRPKTCDPIKFPAIALVVSGGHTELYFMQSEKEMKWLGGTIDDAAGEAFDKSARLLGFGHGGGLAIQEAAKKYRQGKGERIITLPRPMIHDDTLNFSFSGLKTAILREVDKRKSAKQLDEKMISYISYEVQEAITDVLVTKTMRAAETYHASSILLGGGVAANTRLRDKFLSKTPSFAKASAGKQELGTRNQLFFPPVSLCTDNAAYIGSYAFFRGKSVSWKNIAAVPDLSVEVTR